MAKQKKPTKPEKAFHAGNAGELHQTTDQRDSTLTTNQGVAISDNQNSLRSGERGPTLLEDFILREKITHFDHERIPERIVHARGSGAHGYFKAYGDLSDLTRAGFLCDPSIETPVFARFSTVAGGAGSVDLPRDVRGFAVKFYTQEGNFDLVGNNIPVFFIQDAIKFPDLVHAVKMEPDRGYPQAATAHDTFWDFVSLMPESWHMILWAMSDRAIPRSLRMMEGFGVHTFRFVNAKGESTFVKFHWRPKIGSASVLWDEAVKICGADPDFHRRDLFEAIERGDFPEWELSVQTFDQATADGFPFDVLDATKLIPEEMVPLQPIGKMVLNRNPDNFFAETEQVAFHPGHVVPGIDFSDDPLLQGRLFSYTDTQLSRLGGPNFHQIPVNRPRCPMHNFQRDAIMQMEVPHGRVNYEPNSLDPASVRENPGAGFTTHPATQSGDKLRVRSETFMDHYSQARLFYRSMTAPEQDHIVNAFAFELGKVETPEVRCRVLGHVKNVDAELCERVEQALGMEGQAYNIPPAVEPIDMAPSPALSLLGKAEPTLAGRKIGVLLSDGFELAIVDQLLALAEGEGAVVDLIGPHIGEVESDGDTAVSPNHAIAAAPSVLFDSVVLAVSEAGAEAMKREAAVLNFIRDAYAHLKIIGFTASSMALLEMAGIDVDDGVVELDSSGGATAYLDMAKKGRLWPRAAVIKA
ncbi:MAG TPA: catalase [Thiobacillus sp.]|nr:MAG: catalase HPII [Hydrogenophilales bacterium 16-64-40]OZA34909.1 MAG: catalase HPII [Hydrogenophilales bacterium 17-64-65]HQS80990.1 catalase [Thiobacillus sp.]HQT34473.1 catalase [Thiobacillus sp.]